MVQTSLRIVAHLCRIGLAAVFLFAGVMKGLDPAGFVREIEGYGLVSGVLATLGGYILIPLELVVGLALLINYRPALGLIAANGLLVVFIAAIGFAIVTDQPLESCGCFGKNSARTPEQTLVEDLVFLAGGGLAFWILRKGNGRSPAPWKGITLAGGAAASVILTIAAPHLPLDNVATALKPGVQWEDLGIPLAEADLSQGEHFVALMSVTEEPSLESVESINALASTGRFDVLALYSGDEEEYGVFFWTHGPAFPLYHVAPTDMGILHRSLPRYFAVRDGEVKATWATLPSEEEAAGALGAEQNS